MCPQRFIVVGWNWGKGAVTESREGIINRQWKAFDRYVSREELVSIVYVRVFGEECVSGVVRKSRDASRATQGRWRGTGRDCDGESLFVI